MDSKLLQRGLRVGIWSYAASIVGFYTVLAWRTNVTADVVGERVDVSRADAKRDETERAVGTQASDRRLPRVSIIVPARNEERNIRECVESLLAQSYSNFDVFVVDDASTDATPTILADLQRTHPRGSLLHVIRVEMLPAGWAGKPHALHTGAEQADGDWLLFTDADTRHVPSALGIAVREALDRNVDLLSLGTAQDLPDFWGRVLMPFAYMGISMLYPIRKVNDPSSSIALANGQFILLRCALYRAIGGYASPALRSTVLDDRDLAQAVKRGGGRLALIDGRGLVTTRMYHNLREHWNGWSKNAYAGSRGGLPFFLLMIIGLPMVCIVPFLLLLTGLLRRRRVPLLAGATAVGATVAYRSLLNRALGVPWRYIWTHPLGAAVFAGILTRSFWRVRTGRGVEWRGRTLHIQQ